jgi:hypothetical protein
LQSMTPAPVFSRSAFTASVEMSNSLSSKSIAYCVLRIAYCVFLKRKEVTRNLSIFT